MFLPVRPLCILIEVICTTASCAHFEIGRAVVVEKWVWCSLLGEQVIADWCWCHPVMLLGVDSAYVAQIIL